MNKDTASKLPMVWDVDLNIFLFFQSQFVCCLCAILNTLLQPTIRYLLPRDLVSFLFPHTPPARVQYANLTFDVCISPSSYWDHACPPSMELILCNRFFIAPFVTIHDLPQSGLTIDTIISEQAGSRTMVTATNTMISPIPQRHNWHRHHREHWQEY